MDMQSVIDYETIVNRYVELWNSGAGGPQKVPALWAEGARHVAPRITVRGHEELEARVDRSHQHWIVEERCHFRRQGAVNAHHDVVKFVWEMVNSKDEVESVGTEILVLDEAGKVLAAYQFAEG